MALKISAGNVKNASDTIRPADTVKTSSAEFVGAMKTARLESFDNSMEELVNQVKTQGDQFLRSPEEGLLNRYKETIRQFLKRIRDEFLSLKEEFGSENDGERKIYQLVNTSEAEVSSLTRETLTESKALGLLASLDDIRGLVLDVIG